MTPWWFENNLLTRCVSCSVRSPVSRPSPKLASSRLRQRLFGAAASQTSRRKPCYRQSDCFRIHHGCIILRTMFYNAVRLHIAKSSWPVSECLSEKLSQAKIQNIKKQKYSNENLPPSLCLCLFYYLDAERFDSKNFLRAPAWQKTVSCQRVKYDMKCF